MFGALCREQWLGAGPSLPKFQPVSEFSSCMKIFFQKYKTPILWEFGGKIEILSTHDLLCRKFAGVCRNIATSCPPRTFSCTMPQLLMLYFAAAHNISVTACDRELLLCSHIAIQMDGYCVTSSCWCYYYC